MVEVTKKTAGLEVRRPLESQSLEPVDQPVSQSVGFVDDFDTFYNREYRRVVGLGYVLCGSWGQAEDLAQDTMVEVHRRWGRISGYDDPAGWARRVLINKQRSRMRRLASEAKALTRIGGRAQPLLELDPESDHLFSLVRQLPTRQAQALALRYWDDYTIEQTAQAMDCGPETVRTHLKRGMARLETLLSPNGHDDPGATGQPSNRTGWGQS